MVIEKLEFSDKFKIRIDFERRTTESLSYDRTTKYVAVIHRDTDIEHVHIAAFRAKNKLLVMIGEDQPL